VRVERALCALILVGLVGGCTSDGDKPATPDPSAAAPGAAAPGGQAPAWTEPANYSFALSRGCEEAAPVGRYQATVANGKIVTSERIGALSVVPSSSAEVDLGPATEGQQGEEIEVPTLAELVAMATTRSRPSAGTSASTAPVPDSPATAGAICRARRATVSQRRARKCSERAFPPGGQPGRRGPASRCDASHCSTSPEARGRPADRLRQPSAVTSTSSSMRTPTPRSSSGTSSSSGWK
jgi:hypothetical protein